MIIIGIMLTLGLNITDLFDFSNKSSLGNWVVVNDDVMGGRSRASLELTGEGSVSFSGQVSLENNGGFSSVRYNTGKVNVDGRTTLAIHLKGDGKKYQVRVREKSNDYFSYIATFSTSGEWETIEVPLQEMYPSFRGRKLDRSDFEGNSIVELTFLIGNKKAESFTLELQKAFLK